MLILNRAEDSEVLCSVCRSANIEREQSMFAVSSASTRQQHLAQGRRVAAKVTRDQRHAEKERERRAIIEHDH
jgi:hypothetical protein